MRGVQQFMFLIMSPILLISSGAFQIWSVAIFRLLRRSSCTHFGHLQAWAKTHHKTCMSKSATFHTQENLVGWWRLTEVWCQLCICRSNCNTVHSIHNFSCWAVIQTLTWFLLYLDGDLNEPSALPSSLHLQLEDYANESLHTVWSMVFLHKTSFILHFLPTLHFTEVTNPWYIITQLFPPCASCEM
jgi:hypothetical protein